MTATEARERKRLEAAAATRDAIVVLVTPVVQLALAVRDGGPLRVRRPLELADLILALSAGQARVSAG